MYKQRGLLNKTLVLVIILLFVGMSVVSSTGNITKGNNSIFKNYVWELGSKDDNDTTPPVTNCTFNPSEPDGENGWYISNVTVELTATDDLSGVKEIRMAICGDPEIIIPGNYVHFFFDEDCKDYFVDYWAIDNAGNVEPMNRFYINIDKTAPDIDLYYEMDIKKRKLIFIFTAYATELVSGIDRVEFYADNEHKWTAMGPGPEFEWIWKPRNYRHVRGFILRPEITEEYVKFFALIISASIGWSFPPFYAYGYDKAGNNNISNILDIASPFELDEYLLLQNLTLPNDYTGYIGRFFINAEFNTN